MKNFSQPKLKKSLIDSKLKKTKQEKAVCSKLYSRLKKQESRILALIAVRWANYVQLGFSFINEIQLIIKFLMLLSFKSEKCLKLIDGSTSIPSSTIFSNPLGI